MIQLDIDITNMRFEYSDTDTVSDVEYPDSDTDRSNSPLNGFGLEYDRKISVPFSPGAHHLFVPHYVQDNMTVINHKLSHYGFNT